MKLVPDLVLIEFFPQVGRTEPTDEFKEEKARIIQELGGRVYSNNDFFEEFSVPEGTDIRVKQPGFFDWVIPIDGKVPYPGDPDRTFNRQDFFQDAFNKVFQTLNQDSALSQRAIKSISPVYALAVENCNLVFQASPLASSLVIQFEEAYRDELKDTFNEFIYGTITNPIGIESQLQAIEPAISVHTTKSIWLKEIGCIYITIDQRVASSTIFQIRADIEAQIPQIQTSYREQTPITALNPSTATTNPPINWNTDRIRVPDALTLVTPDPNITVAVIDSGIKHDHPNLTGSILPGVNTYDPDNLGSNSIRNFDSHGTCVAGIIVGNPNPAPGANGIANGCKVLPITLELETDVEVCMAICYSAYQGAKVLNLSLGVYGDEDCLYPWGWNFSLIDKAIFYAYFRKNASICAATGNEFQNSIIKYPARNPYVIACGAINYEPNEQNVRRYNSNYGSMSYFTSGRPQTGKISVVAPGDEIYTTLIPVFFGGTTLYFIGFNDTSAATAHVSAVIALMLSKNSGLTPPNVRRIVEGSTEVLGSTYPEVNGWYNDIGYGLIRADKAVSNTPSNFLPPNL